MASDGLPGRRGAVELSRTQPVGRLCCVEAARPRVRPRGDRLILQAMEGQFRKTVVRDSATLIELAAADAGECAAGRDEEPEVLASTGRHLSEPLIPTGGPIAYLPEDAGAE